MQTVRFRILPCKHIRMPHGCAVAPGNLTREVIGRFNLFVLYVNLPNITMSLPNKSVLIILWVSDLMCMQRGDVDFIGAAFLCVKCK